jgi:arsenate reductase
MSDVIIYHNPDCGTSRNVLALIRNAGVEPTIIEYLKTPPSREKLVELIARARLKVREAVRIKGTPFHELGLDDPKLSNDQLIDAMLDHPILNQSSIRGIALGRPAMSSVGGGARHLAAAAKGRVPKGRR